MKDMYGLPGVNLVQGHSCGNGRGVSLIQGVAEKAGTVQ